MSVLRWVESAGGAPALGCGGHFLAVVSGLSPAAPTAHSPAAFRNGHMVFPLRFGQVGHAARTRNGDPAASGFHYAENGTLTADTKQSGIRVGILVYVMATPVVGIAQKATSLRLIHFHNSQDASRRPCPAANGIDALPRYSPRQSTRVALQFDRCLFRSCGPLNLARRVPPVPIQESPGCCAKSDQCGTCRAYCYRSRGGNQHSRYLPEMPIVTLLQKPSATCGL